MRNWIAVNAFGSKQRVSLVYHKYRSIIIIYVCVIATKKTFNVSISEAGYMTHYAIEVPTSYFSKLLLECPYILFSGIYRHREWKKERLPDRYMSLYFYSQYCSQHNGSKLQWPCLLVLFYTTHLHYSVPHVSPVSTHLPDVPTADFPNSPLLLVSVCDVHKDISIVFPLPPGGAVVARGGCNNNNNNSICISHGSSCSTCSWSSV